MLQLQNIDVGYGKKILLENISADVLPGSFIGVLGINGIGKSTLLKTIAGLLAAVNGNVLLNGKELHQLSISRKSELVSMASTDKVDILYMTVREFVALGKMRFTNSFNALTGEHLEHVNVILSELKLHHLASKYIGEISDGEKQKAVIARCVAQDTPVMILDEPTAFLDFRNKKIVFEYLSVLAAERGKVILASSHDLELAFTYNNSWWVIDEHKQFAIATTAIDAQQILRL